MTGDLYYIFGVYLIAAFVLLRFAFSLGEKLIKFGAIAGMLMIIPNVKNYVGIGLMIVGLIFVYKLLIRIKS